MTSAGSNSPTPLDTQLGICKEPSREPPPTPQSVAASVLLINRHHRRDYIIQYAVMESEICAHDVSISENLAQVLSVCPVRSNFCILKLPLGSYATRGSRHWIFADGCTIYRLETSVRGLILKLSFMVTVTRVFTARNSFRPVIGLFHSFRRYNFYNF